MPRQIVLPQQFIQTPTAAPLPTERPPEARGKAFAMEAFFRALPAHWREQLEGRPSDTVFTRLSPSELSDVQADVAERLSQARADSTWGTIASPLNQFRQFAAVQAEDFQLMSIEEKMTIFIEYKLQQGQIGGTSAQLYLKKFNQAYKLVFGEHSAALKEFQAAITRTSEPPQGAVPASPQDIRNVMETARTEAVRIQTHLMWLTAARCDDVNRLLKAHITVHPRAADDLNETLVTVAWPSGTKAGPRPLADLVVMSPPQAAALQTYLNHLPDQCPVCPLRHAAYTRILQNVNPNLTAHSVKKGALIALLQQNHSLADVAFKAKHRSLNLLQTYVGAEMWAIANGAIEMSSTLSRKLFDH
jgi:hypothetical protein